MLILAAIAVFDPGYFWPALELTAGAIGQTAGFIAFAVTGAVLAGQAVA